MVILFDFNCLTVLPPVEMEFEAAKLEHANLQKEKSNIAEQKEKDEEKLKKFKDTTTVAYITAPAEKNHGGSLGTTSLRHQFRR